MLLQGLLIFTSGEEKSCKQPTTGFPGGQKGAMGSYFPNNNALVCGGQLSDGTNTNLCYKYAPETQDWTPGPSMVTDRYMGSATMLQGNWFLTGGITGGYRSSEVGTI